MVSTVPCTARLDVAKTPSDKAATRSTLITAGRGLALIVAPPDRCGNNRNPC